MIRATIVYLFIGLYVVIMAPIGMTLTMLSKNTSLIYGLARICVRIAGWMCQIKVRVHGRDKIAPGQSYLFLSNHQGNFDGPVLLHTIPRDFRALIKKEMMRIPILSLVLRHLKFVPIDRRDPVRARASIDSGAELLRSGLSFIAFPEGTRSRDGRLQEFKKGVFVMALKARAPIMPISILNTSMIQPPGSYAIRPATVELIFHDPIPTKDMSFGDRDRLVQMTRRAIASALPSESSVTY